MKFYRYEQIITNEESSVKISLSRIDSDILRTSLNNQKIRIQIPLRGFCQWNVRLIQLGTNFLQQIFYSSKSYKQLEAGTY
jgi:hypothetical protein